MAGKSEFLLGRAPRVLLACSDSVACAAIAGWCVDEGVKLVVVGSCREALNLLQDIVFIESALDAMLVDAELSDGTGLRVIREYRHEFPALPTALMGGVNDDIALGVWSKAKQIQLIRKPVEQAAISEWLGAFRAARVGDCAKLAGRN